MKKLSYDNIRLTKCGNERLAEIRARLGDKAAREWKIRFIRAGVYMTFETWDKARKAGLVVVGGCR